MRGLFAHATTKLQGNELSVRWHDGREDVFGAAALSGAGVDRMDFPFDWHMAQIAEFAEAVQAGRDPVSSGKTALDAHRLIDALLASARKGRKMAVVQG